MKKKKLVILFVTIFILKVNLLHSQEPDVSVTPDLPQTMIIESTAQSMGRNNMNTGDATDDIINRKLKSIPYALIVGYKNLDTVQKLTAAKTRSESEIIASKKRLIDVQPVIDQYRASKPAARNMTAESAFNAVYKNMRPEEKKLFNTYVLEVKSGISLDQALEKLKADENVEYVEPNYIYRTSAAPQDELYPQQWAHQNTEAELGWEMTKGSPEVVVAVIDTGVDYLHEDLKANIWYSPEGYPGKDFVDIDTEQYIANGLLLIPEEDYTEVDNDPSDFDGHGTHCSGIIAASENSTGIVGVGPQLKIMPVRTGFTIIIATPGGEHHVGILETDDIVNGIYYAVKNGAHVLNMSFGVGSGFQALKSALDYAHAEGVVAVAAAGNGNTASISYPAGFDTVIAVGATDSLDQKAFFSNYGNWVDVSAPGVNILSSVPEIGPAQDPSGYKSMSGTSMSCPYVAGLAGLILSENTQLSPGQVKAVLQSSTDPVKKSPYDSRFYYVGTGRVNVHKALSLDVDQETQVPLAEITSPVLLENIIADKIEVRGTAICENYKLEYTDDPDSENWDLISTGTTVEDGLLGMIEVTDETQTGILYFRLTSQTGDLYAISWVNVFLFDAKPGWPKNLHGDTYGTPIVMDVDGDGTKEVIAANYLNRDLRNSHLYLFNHDGSLRWVKEFKASEIYGSITAGDIDNDGLVEILFLLDPHNTLCAIKADGTEMTGNWPLPLGFYRILNINLFDINNDGFQEVIITGSPHGGKQNIFIYNHDGTPFPGWPVKVEENLTARIPAVADLDLDGYPEIIFGSSYYGSGPFGETNFYIYRYNGENFSEKWPVAIEGQVFTAPAIGDVDHDGQYEIVVKSTGGVTVLDLEGQPISDKWPCAFANTNFLTKSMPPVLADLDHDRDLEIIFNVYASEDSKLWLVYHHDGTQDPLWDPELPVETVGWSDDNFNPAIADLDGDGNMEILDSNHSALTVLSRTGEYKESLSKPFSIYNYVKSAIFPRSPVIADLDNDGNIEVVCTNIENDLFVFQYEGAFEEESVEWNGFGNGSQRTYTKPILYAADIETRDWGTGYDVNIVLSNNSKTDIDGWKFEFDWDREITRIWGAEIISYENNHYILGHLAWNQTINSGHRVEFGFITNPGNVTQDPQNYLLNHRAVQTKYVTPSELSFDIETHYDLSAVDYQAEMVITNTSNTKAVGWNIAFDFDQAIESIWDAKIVRQDGNHYLISNVDQNTIINPGESVAFNFRGQLNGGFVEPDNFKINGDNTP